MATVMLVNNGQTFQYELPAHNLLDNGIKVVNQPFQMDEVELQVEGGGKFVGYQFRPLAKESDAYVEPLSFDADRKEKLALILKKFAKA